MSDNPLLTPSTLPYGAPDFSRIRPEHYLPAFKEAVRQKREEIQKIVDNKATPTFQNTIVAFEHSGQLLDRISSVFFCITEAAGTPEIDAQPEVLPAREVRLQP